MPSEAVVSQKPFHVLVLGGSYAGLAATVNLLDLCQGKACRFAARYGNAVDGGEEQKVPVRITIVDERDGFCEFFFSPFSYSLSC